MPYSYFTNHIATKTAINITTETPIAIEIHIDIDIATETAIDIATETASPPLPDLPIIHRSQHFPN